MVNANDPDKHDLDTDMVDGLVPLAHVEGVLLGICTLYRGLMNFGEGNSMVINTPYVLIIIAKWVRELGVKPEMKVFDTGNLWCTKTIYDEGLFTNPPMCPICLGIPYSALADTALMKVMADAVLAGAVW